MSGGITPAVYYSNHCCPHGAHVPTNDFNYTRQGAATRHPPHGPTPPRSTFPRRLAPATYAPIWTRQDKRGLYADIVPVPLRTRVLPYGTRTSFYLVILQVRVSLGVSDLSRRSHGLTGYTGGLVSKPWLPLLWRIELHR